MQEPRIIISGGGTGGHVFPAIAIANELKAINPKVKILFVGANGRMEMEKVPEAGYEIIGLNISGLQRSLSLKNLSFPFKLLRSIMKSRAIIKHFKPQVAVGVGGYASGPLLYVASRKKIPCLIQEQNSFPGITNKLLAKRVSRICVAYDKMERFFPKDKLHFTGNPVRKEVIQLEGKRPRGFEHFDREQRAQHGTKYEEKSSHQCLQYRADEYYAYDNGADPFDIERPYFPEPALICGGVVLFKFSQ